MDALLIAVVGGSLVLPLVYVAVHAYMHFRSELDVHNLSRKHQYAKGIVALLILFITACFCTQAVGIYQAKSVGDVVDDMWGREWQLSLTMMDVEKQLALQYYSPAVAQALFRRSEEKLSRLLAPRSCLGAAAHQK